MHYIPKVLWGESMAADDDGSADEGLGSASSRCISAYLRKVILKHVPYHTVLQLHDGGQDGIAKSERERRHTIEDK